MIVGMPGSGLGGVFYLCLGALMPGRELLARRGRNPAPARRWRLILGQFLLCAGVVAVLAGDAWLLHHALRPDPIAEASVATPNGTATAAAIMPAIAALPFLLLLAILIALPLAHRLLPVKAADTAAPPAPGSTGGTAMARPATMALAVLLSLVGCLHSPPPVPPGFAVHVPDGFDFATAIGGEELSVAEFCSLHAEAIACSSPTSPYGDALANQTLGLVVGDPSAITLARYHYARAMAMADDARQRALCQHGMAYCDAILSGAFASHSPDADRLEPVIFRRSPRPAAGFRRIILGESQIRLGPRAVVRTQVDRVVRDWLQSFQVRNAPWSISRDALANSHEGFIVGQILDACDVHVTPVFGTPVRKFGTSWFAPDAEGVYRFEISPDKVIEFPSTILVDERTALINDTHGISALAWDSLGTDLVIGCGDHPGKMDAACYLATHGVNVYVPTDRCLGLLMGVRTPGTIIGSAPVRKEGGEAVIGNQPVAIDVDETIVVAAAATGEYPLKYYDTPHTYFQALQDYAGHPLHLVAVPVVEYGHAEVVIDAARKIGAQVVAIRVKSALEHDAVAEWLRQDPARRALLFHTAAYPDGFRLFAEFPRQTSFGDIHPRFE